MCTKYSLHRWNSSSPHIRSKKKCRTSRLYRAKQCCLANSFCTSNTPRSDLGHRDDILPGISSSETTFPNQKTDSNVM
jgi:hypothetical protein